MSYDHWLYKPSSQEVGPITEWTSNHFDSLGHIAEFEAALAKITTVQQSRKSSVQPDYWQFVVISISNYQENYEIVPRIREDGHIESLSLRGATREDAVFLAEGLNLYVYDPQLNQNVMSYK
ncbi:MAG: hypothetical protein AAF512_23755 [Pseudomonadota bacterium]